MKKIAKWVGIGFGAIVLLSVGASLGGSSDEALPVETTIATATTTTIAPATTTTTVAPTTTTTEAPPPPTTTTTQAAGITRERWNDAAINVLRDTEYFVGWTSTAILDSIDLVCETAYEYRDGIDFVLEVVSTGDDEFMGQVATVLGVLSVSPGCPNPRHQQYVDEAYDFIEDF